MNQKITQIMNLLEQAYSRQKPVGWAQDDPDASSLYFEILPYRPSCFKAGEAAAFAGRAAQLIGASGCPQDWFMDGGGRSKKSPPSLRQAQADRLQRKLSEDRWTSRFVQQHFVSKKNMPKIKKDLIHLWAGFVSNMAHLCSLMDSQLSPVEDWRTPLQNLFNQHLDLFSNQISFLLRDDLAGDQIRAKGSALWLTAWLIKNELADKPDALLQQAREQIEQLSLSAFAELHTRLSSALDANCAALNRHLADTLAPTKPQPDIVPYAVPDLTDLLDDQTIVTNLVKHSPSGKKLMAKFGQWEGLLDEVWPYASGYDDNLMPLSCLPAIHDWWSSSVEDLFNHWLYPDFSVHLLFLPICYTAHQSRQNLSGCTDPDVAAPKPITQDLADLDWLCRQLGEPSCAVLETRDPSDLPAWESAGSGFCVLCERLARDLLYPYRQSNDLNARIVDCLLQQARLLPQTHPLLGSLNVPVSFLTENERQLKWAVGKLLVAPDQTKKAVAARLMKAAGWSMASFARWSKEVMENFMTAGLLTIDALTPAAIQFLLLFLQQPLSLALCTPYFFKLSQYAKHAWLFDPTDAFSKAELAYEDDVKTDKTPIAFAPLPFTPWPQAGEMEEELSPEDLEAIDVLGEYLFELILPKEEPEEEQERQFSALQMLFAPFCGLSSDPLELSGALGRRFAIMSAHLMAQLFYLSGCTTPAMLESTFFQGVPASVRTLLLVLLADRLRDLDRQSVPSLMPEPEAVVQEDRKTLPKKTAFKKLEQQADSLKQEKEALEVRLQNQEKEMQNQNRQYADSLAALNAQLKAEQEKNARLEENMQELHKLRSALFEENTQPQKQSSDELSDLELEELKQLMDRHPVAFVGGHYHLHDQLTALYPNIRIINSPNFDRNSLLGCDLGVFFYKFISHPTYHKAMDVFRKSKIPMEYLGIKNLQQTQRELFRFLRSL